MATIIQQLKGTAAEVAAKTYSVGVLVWNETAKRWHGHDGVTAGGIAMARYDERNDGSLGDTQCVETAATNGVTVADTGKAIIGNRGTAIAFNLDPAASLTSKFVAMFKNIGAGAMTVVPNGTELIDDANAAITVPTGSSVIIKGDGTSFRTFLSNGDVTGSAINNAAALTGANLADNDKFGIYDVSAGALVSLLVSELIAAIFKTTRKIANAYFLSSFRLWDATDNTKGLAFDLSPIPTGTTRTFKPFNAGTFAVLQHQTTSGTSGGTNVATTWTTRPITTEVVDVDNVVSVASNQFTPTIDCLCSVAASFDSTGQTCMRLWNVTDGVEVAPSIGGFFSLANNGAGNLPLVSKVLGGKTYRIEYFPQSVSSAGLGRAVSAGGAEVHMSVLLQGLAS